MPRNSENTNEPRMSWGVPNLPNKFLQKIHGFIWSFSKQAEASLSSQEKYKEVKKIMEDNEIGEFSLEWAKLLIENWLWYYVVATIKNFPENIHDDIVDLLLLNHEGSLLLWTDNNMVVDFKVDTEKTLHKLYYTGQWLSFKGVSMPEIDRMNENRQVIPNEIKWLKEFEWNLIIRRLILEQLNKKEDWYLIFLFKQEKIDNYRNLFTEKEFAENSDFIDRLEKILK